MSDNAPITDNESAPVTAPDGVDPDKMKKLIERVKALKSGVPAADAPAEQSQPEAPPQEARPITGRDVDWSEYDLDFNLRHLYETAVLRDTQDGPKWVAVVTEFYSEELYNGSHGKRTKQNMPLNLGEFLTHKLMAGEGWKLSGIIPAGLGKSTILLERANPVVLPDPMPLEKETKLEPMTDEELAAAEKHADDWAAGLTPEQNVDTVAPRPAALAAAADALAALDGPDFDTPTEGEPDVPSN